MSDDSTGSDDLDFEGEMKHLAHEIDVPKDSRAAKLERSELLLAMGEMVRPLAIDMDQLKRASSDNNLLLTALGKTLNAQRSVPQSLETVASEMKRLHSVESANQKLFDALHGELKTYKDNFLFDALQRPFIRDLVNLYDDFSAVHAQVGERLRELQQEAPADGGETAFLDLVHGNLENSVHHLLEVFLRMEVNIVKTPVGAPHDKKLHRTVAVAPAKGPADDSLIERSVKPGFFWRERTVRPEEVVVRRWNAEASESDETSSPDHSDPPIEDLPS